jgi:RNA-dependent RNA polymerase
MFQELPSNGCFPNFRQNFVNYEEIEGRYTLESGSPFSRNLYVVPIVAPPQGIYIPYDFLFKVNSLVQHGCISGSELDNDFYRLDTLWKRCTIQRISVMNPQNG